jgi:Ca2+/Na+ antiporter
MWEMNQQFLIAILVFIVFLALVAKTIILSRQKKENLAPKPSHNKPNVIRNKDESLKRKNKITFVIAGFLILLGVIVFSFTKAGGKDGDISGTISSMTPIWIAIFIPFMASKKKKDKAKAKEDFDKEITPEQKRISVFMFIALIFLVILGITLLILFKN